MSFLASSHDSCFSWPYKYRSYPTMDNIDYTEYSINSVVTHFAAYSYISCYREPKLSFQLYTGPFQWPIWLLLGITLIVCTILVDIFTQFVLKLNSSTSFLYFLGSILEETSSLPTNLIQSFVFKISIGPCILLTMILSQAYVGLVINGLKAPLPPKKYDTVATIQNLNDECGKEEKDLANFSKIT